MKKRKKEGGEWNDKERGIRYKNMLGEKIEKWSNGEE